MREVLGALEVVDHSPALGLAVLGCLPRSDDIYLKDKEELVTENGKKTYQMFWAKETAFVLQDIKFDTWYPGIVRMPK